MSEPLKPGDRVRYCKSFMARALHGRPDLDPQFTAFLMHRRGTVLSFVDHDGEERAKVSWDDQRKYPWLHEVANLRKA